MALSLTTAIKNKVASRIYSGRTYAALGAGYQQDLIDFEGASALTMVENLAQWFSLTALTANATAPDQWEFFLVDEIIARVELNAHPERAQQAQQQARRSMQAAVESYSRLAIDYSPASTTEAFIYHCLNNRKYVLSHCIRLKPALFPDIATVDAALEETAVSLFNRAGWTFRRRPVTMVVTRTAFTGGTWTESTKTISGLTGVGSSLPTGTRFYVTGGTGANKRDFPITSTTSTTIVLTQSLGSDANTQTDIAGFYYVVTFEGLQASESFDSIASTRFFYTGDDEGELCWQSADDFAKNRAYDGTETGQPCCFRTHQPAATTTAFLLSPPPDASYTLRGEVFTLTPADPGSGTETTMFDKFAAEFLPTMRRAQLDRVLTNYGRTNEQMHSEVTDEIERLLPEYQDPGSPDGEVGIRDVYEDRQAQSGGYW
jgi:hypothetical protein